MRDLVRTEAGGGSRISPGVEYASVRFFRKLAAVLPLAIRYRQEIARRSPKPWGVPKTFFFHSPDESQPAPTPAPPPTALPSDPDGAAMAAILPDLLADALTLACSATSVRHVARAVPELVSLLKQVSDVPGAKTLQGMLEIPDDETVRVVDPARGYGVRVRVSGVATVGQFQILLAASSPALFPRYRVRADVYEAALDGLPPGADLPIATIPAQFYHPRAWNSESGFPSGFDGSSDWFWEHQPLQALPRIHGDRVVYVGPAVYPRMWEVEKPFPTILPQVELLQILPVSEVLSMAGRPNHRNPTPMAA